MPEYVVKIQGKTSGMTNSFEIKMFITHQGHSKFEFVHLIYKGPDFVLIEPEAICVSHMTGKNLLVGR